MRDVQNIAEYVEEAAGVRVARQLVERLQSTCTMLAETQGELGVARPELADAVRSFPVRPHVVFFRYTDRDVQIVRILHERRDVPAEFRRELSG